MVLFSIACGFLANWQFSRREIRLAAMALVEQNYSQPPSELQTLLVDGDFQLPQSTWRQVILVGTYDLSKELLVRNRPNNGQPGFEQLVPFLENSGLTIWVSRGWLPTGRMQDSPDDNPLPPQGKITLVGHLLPSEQELARGAPQGQIATINVKLANLTLASGASDLSGYLRLVSETPVASQQLVQMPKPTLDEGNNLSYAIQWIVFALMSAFALFWRIRRDRELEPKLRKKPSRSQLDNAAEDGFTTKK